MYPTLLIFPKIVYPTLLIFPKIVYPTLLITPKPIPERGIATSDEEPKPDQEKPKEEPKKDPEQQKKPEVRTGSGNRPVNKYGEPYPKMIDPRTGEPVPFPEELKYTPKEDRVEWNKITRGQFITEWIDQGYSQPPSGWEGYDMHHILPKEWGGTNDFENLVPLRRGLHQLIVTPWWNTYEPEET